MSSRPDVLAFAQQAVEAARRQGAVAADAFVRTADRTVIEVRGGEVENLQRAAAFGLGLRAQIEGRTVLVHTTSTEAKDLDDLAARAVAMARALPRPKEAVPFAGARAIAGLPEPDPELEGEPHDEKCARLVAIERAMLGVSGVTTSSGIGYEETHGELALANSNGLVMRSPHCSIEIGAEAIAEGDGESYTGSSYYSLPARRLIPAPETIGREAGERAVRLLGARTIPSARLPVVFARHVGWTVLACLAQPLRGDRVVQGRSYLADQIDHQIAAPGVTIGDNPLMDKGPGWRHFDGEGTPSRNLTLVENGVLKSFLTDLASAASLGVTPGGNAGRDGYNAGPAIGTTNYHMAAGPHALDDIIRDTKRGLLVSVLSGWWVGMSSTTDTFSAAAMGHYIENGEMVHPVKGISVGGSLREMLAGIDRIGNDLSITHLTCVPTFRVAEMAVSGA